MYTIMHMYNTSDVQLIILIFFYQTRYCRSLKDTTQLQTRDCFLLIVWYEFMKIIDNPTV
jgi:hypothetical protein